MKKSTMLLMISTLLSTTVVLAADNNEALSIDQKLGSLRIEKMQAELMIETMARRGKLNHDEVSRAKREIASVKEDDEKNYKAEALENLSSKTSYATK